MTEATPATAIDATSANTGSQPYSTQSIAVP